MKEKFPRQKKRSKRVKTKNKLYNRKPRHIRRMHNNIKNLLYGGIFFIDYVESKENIADPFNKGVSRYSK